MAVKPIPEGYHTLTPSLTVRNAERAIEFYKQAFGAEVRGGVAKGPDGKVMHAELKIGDSVIMLSDIPNSAPSHRSRSATPGWGCISISITWTRPSIAR
jgi:uncharacterized glyoxalase superfamily protein PhnB